MDAVIHFRGSDGEIEIPISKFVMWTTSKLIKYMIDGMTGCNTSDGIVDSIPMDSRTGRTIIPIVNETFQCAAMEDVVRFLHEQGIDAEHVKLENHALPILVYLGCTDAPRVHDLAKFRVSQLTRYHAFLMNEAAYEQPSSNTNNIWPDCAVNLIHPFVEFIASMNPLEWMPLTRKKLVTEESMQILCVLLFYTKPSTQHAERIYLIIKHFLTVNNVQYHRFFPSIFRFYVAVGCRASYSDWHRSFKDIMTRLFPLDFFSSQMEVPAWLPKTADDAGSPMKYMKGIWTMECDGPIHWYVATIPMPYSTVRTERVDIDRAPANIDIKVQNHRHLEDRIITVTFVMTDTYRQPRHSEQDVYVWLWSDVNEHLKKCYRLTLGHSSTASRQRKVREVYSFNAIPARQNINNKQVFVAIAVVPLQKAYLDYYIPVCSNV
jgi:hypothetical protein